MKDEPVPDPWQHPSVRGYWLVCLAALLAVTVALLFRQLGTWSLLPLLAGSLSLAGRWRFGPLLTLGALGWVLYSERSGLTPLDQLEYLFMALLSVISGKRVPYIPGGIGLGETGRYVPSDLVLCAGVLAYCGAHFRLLGLGARIFPKDQDQLLKPLAASPRPRGIEPRRSEQTVTPGEMYRLLMLVPAVVAAAALAWSWVAPLRAPVLEWPSSLGRAIHPQPAAPGGRVTLELQSAVWQALVLTWALGLGALTVAAVIAYLGWRRMSPAEAALFLQDTLWRETCREQRLLNRLLVRARLRQRKAEGSP